MRTSLNWRALLSNIKIRKMAILYFRVSAQYDEVIRLRKECEKLETQLKKMDVNKAPAAARALETQLAASRQQMMGLVTEAAKAGAVMENDLKKKLNSASKASDELTEEIIKQRKIIRDTQDDVRRLSEQYNKMGKYSPKSSETLSELNRAKAALNEQRYSLGELQDQQARNRLEVRKLTREYKEFASGTNNADEVVKSLTDSLKRTVAEIGGLVAIKKFGSDIIDATGKMQQLQVALSTILQDKSKADALLADISRFAVTTPFSIDEVATGAKQLLAYGSSADNVVAELSMLGDVASGLQIPLGQLIYLYGTLRTQGRAMTVDIRQFAGRGIPIYEQLAKVLGVTKDEVSGLVTEGKVGFKEVEQAFKNMTSEGGQFNNMLANSAGTWPQQIAAVEEKLFLKLNEFGNKYKEVFEFGIGTAEDLVESLDDVLSVMGGLIAAYGIYKAALITAAVAQKAVGFVESIRLIVMYRKELGLATAAQQAFNIASKSNVYVTLLAALVGIGTAVYMFTKRTNEATAAQETLNSVNKKADEEFSRQASTIDRLNGVLKSETASLNQKKETLSQLQSIIPNYNASLDEEGKLINSNTEAIKAYLTQLEKQIRLKAAQEELEELYRKKRTQEKQQKAATENYDEAKSLYNSSVTTTRSALQTRGINTGVAIFSQNSAVNNQLKDSANKAKKELDSVNKELGETVSAITELEKEIEKSSLSDKKEPPQSTISKEIESATKRIKTLEQEIADLRSGKLQAEAGKTVESAIKAKEKELQSAEKTLETLTGVRKMNVSRENSITSVGGKLSDLERKQAIERAKEAIDMENQVEQSRIDAMADGGDKILAQRELNNKKEMQAIDRAKEEYIQKEIQRQKEIFEATEELKAKQNPKYKKRSFDSSTVTVDTSTFDILKENTDKRQVQEDLNAQREAMNAYLAEYGTYMQKRQAIIEQYQDKINKATTEGEKLTLGKQRDSILSGIDEQANKTTSAVSQLFGDMKDKTLKDLEAINAAGQKALEFLKSGQWDEQKGKELGITKENFETWSNDPEKIKAISDALVNNRKAADDLQPAYKKVADGIKDAFNAGNDSKKLEEALARIKNGLNDIIQVGSFLSDTLSSLGDAFGNDTLTGIADGINVAMDAMNSTMQGAQAGAMFGPIGAAAGAAAGLVSSLATSIAKIHDSKNEKNIEKLQDQIDVLDASYNQLARSIEKAYSTDASDLIDQQNELLEQQKLLIQQQIQEEKDKKKTDDDRIKDWEQQIKDIDEQILDNVDKAKEAIAGISFDSFRSNFLDSLSDMDTKVEDFADDFEEYLKTAILNGLMADKYDSQIKALYDKWTAYGGDGLTEAEVEQLRKDYKEIASAMVTDRDNLAQIYGWESESAKDQQSASSRGFGSEMTHEDAGELSGRFTAVYESNLRIEAAEQQQTVAITQLTGSISALTAQASGMYNIADETRTILANSYLELQQIRENTEEIIKPIKQMQADMAEVKRNTSRL